MLPSLLIIKAGCGICVGIKFASTNLTNCIPASDEEKNATIITIINAYFSSDSNLPFSYDSKFLFSSSKAFC